MRLGLVLACLSLSCVSLVACESPGGGEGGTTAIGGTTDGGTTSGGTTSGGTTSGGTTGTGNSFELEELEELGLRMSACQGAPMSNAFDEILFLTTLPETFVQAVRTRVTCVRSAV